MELLRNTPSRLIPELSTLIVFKIPYCVESTLQNDGVYIPFLPPNSPGHV